MKIRPEVLNGKTKKLKTGCGSCYLTMNKDDKGELVEVKATLGKAGGCINTMLYREAILWSILLQLEADKKDLIKLLKKHWVGLSCENAEKLVDGRISSCGDTIGRAILEELEAK